MAILDAILEGKRDPVELAALCHRRVKSSCETVVKALPGNYRREHVSALKQSLDACGYYQRLIAELDEELATYLKELPTSEVAQPKLLKRTKRLLYQREHYDPAFDLRE